MKYKKNRQVKFGYMVAIMFLFIFAYAISSCSPDYTLRTVHATTTERISNGGFESGLTDWTTYGDVNYTTLYSHSGSQSAMMGNPNTDNWIKQVLATPTTIKDINSCSAWIKPVYHNSAVDPYGVYIAAWTVSGGEAMCLELHEFPVGVWTQVDILSYIVSWEIAPSDPITAIGFIGYMYGSPYNYICIDDVSLLYEYHPQLITNGDFETGDAAGWTTAGAYADVVRLQPHTGAYSLRTGYSSYIQQSFNATLPEDIASFDCWLYAEYFGGFEPYDFNIRIEYNDTIYSTSWNEPLMYDAWTYVDILSHATAGKHIDFVFFSNFEDVWDYVYIDDVSLLLPPASPPPDTPNLYSITLNSPAHGSTVYNNRTVDFKWTPVWTHSDAYIAAAILHVGGVSTANTSALINSTINTISYTLPSYATYSWYVVLYNSTSSIQSSTRTITAVLNSSYVPPIINPNWVNGTLFFRSDGWTVHGVPAFRLTGIESSSVVEDKDTLSGVHSTSYGVRIWAVLSNDQQIELTNGQPQAVVTRSSDGAGLQTGTWDASQFYYITDSLLVKVYQRFDSGSWLIQRTYITDEELLWKFPASPWTVNYYTNKTTGASTDSSFFFGDLTHLSSMTIMYERINPWEEMMYWLSKGQLINFFVTPWYYTIGQLFYGLLTLFFVVTTYNWFGSIRAVLGILWLFGGAGGVLTLMIPAIGLSISWLIMGVALAITLFKLFR